MLLTALIRRQLRIFAVIATVALGLAFFGYARVQTMVGVGVYEVKVDFADASGLYPTALVTHRGVEVGKVAHLDVTAGGAVATLRLDSGTEIPADARAELRSTSAIGEQFVDLVTPDGAGPFLHDGSTIPRTRSVAMPQITPVLDSVNRLLASVPRDQTRAVLAEVGHGLGGAGQDLGRIIDASGQLLTEAQAHIDATTSLIAAARPVLSTQRDLGPRTRGYAAALDQLTGALAADDTVALRTLLREGPAGLDKLSGTVSTLQPTLPMLLYNLTTSAQVLNTYLPNVRQLLVVYPATIARIQSMANPRAGHGDASFDLRASFGNPPSCSRGYPPRSERRSPTDTTLRPRDPLAHCATPASDPSSVRGARNLPCPNSARRGPLPKDCGLSFRRGRWPATSGSVAYDLAVGSTEGDAVAPQTAEKNGENLWQILVLAPLAVQ